MTPSDRGIVLVGFMGAGKTTVGRELAAQLDREFVDLDELVIQRSGRSIAAMIASEGEAFFRARETEALHQALTAQQGNVISLGGGTWTIPGNRELIEANELVSIWVDTEFDVCWARIQKSETERPLVSDEVQTRALFERRRECYSTAQHRYRSAGATEPEEIARAIITELWTRPESNRAG